MTDAEIIEALECLTGEPKLCKGCPYNNTERYPFCRESCAKDALDLINRQKAEIERLKEENHHFADIGKMYSEIKAEAIKEFAERLKATPLRFGVEYTEYYDKPSIYKLVLFIDDNDIDNLVKEMAGDTE